MEGAHTGLQEVQKHALDTIRIQITIHLVYVKQMLQHQVILGCNYTLSISAHVCIQCELFYISSSWLSSSHPHCIIAPASSS